MSDPRVLVLTLYSGENELDACKKSVSEQRGVAASQEIFENLPNIEAHRALYSRIMEKRDEYDWFVKLDADMVLRHPTSLKQAIEYIETQPDNHGMAIFTVHDWPTGGPIWGINFFDPSCHWNWVSETKVPDGLFVDPDPECAGTRLVVKSRPSPIADHMPDPSDWQAFFFGFHRGLKACSKEDGLPSPRSKIQWNILCKVAAHYRRSKDRKLALVLAGTNYALALDKQGKLPETINKDDERPKQHLETLKNMSETELHLQVQRYWGNSVVSKLYWYLLRDGLIAELGRLLKRRQA
jgi:hypothetical protein